MSLLKAQGVIQWLVTDPVNTTYSVVGLPFEPKGIRFVATSLQSAADAATQSISKRTSLGLQGTNGQRSISAVSVDGSSVGDCGSSMYNNCVVAQNDAGGFTVGRLTLSAINSDGFELISSDVPTGSFTVMWEAWGGSDITVAVIGEIAEPAAIGDVDYTVNGFEAGATDQVVMIVGIQSTAAINTVMAVDSGVCVGFASGGADAENVVLCGNADDGALDTVTDGYCKTGQCLAMIAVGGGNPNAMAKLTQFGTNSFRLNWLARAVTGRRYMFLAIKGGRWKAGAYTIAGNSVGATATISALPFVPVGITLIGRRSIEQSSGVADANDRLGFGAGVSPSSRMSHGVLDVDNVANASIHQVLEYDQVLAFPTNSGTLQSACDLNALTADSIQIIVDVAGGVANEWQGFLTYGSAIVTMAASATCACGSSAALSTQIPFGSVSSSSCAVSASITTQTTFRSDSTGACATSAGLATLSSFSASATCRCSTTFFAGDLIGLPTLACSTVASLFTGLLWQDVGFNFRSTIGFVTDATKQVAVLNNFYPFNFLVDGVIVTAGWLGTGPTLLANRDAGLDRRLAGVHAKDNTGTQVAFRVRLPEVGNWIISLALGDTVAQGFQRIELYDASELFAVIEVPAGSSAGQWYAADGLPYDQTTWPSDGSTKTLTHGFIDSGDGSAFLTVIIGATTPQAGATTLAHLRIVVSPDQGAILRAHPTCQCATFSLFDVPFSASATGHCSTDAEIGIRINAIAGASCSTTMVNLLAQSEQFDDAAWLKVVSMTIATDDAVSPTGELTADKLIESAGFAANFLYQQPLIPAGTLLTSSIYAKAAERSKIAVVINAQGVQAAAFIFDLIDGTITDPFGAPAGATALATAAPNSYYRCEVSWRISLANPFLQFFIVSDNDELSYVGDGTSGLHVWGAQLDVGSPAGPYIPVTTPTVGWTTLQTAITAASAPSCVCSVAADLTAVTRTLRARAGCSASTTGQATTALVRWNPNSEIDLAGYKLYRGTAPGVYDFTLDLGLLQPNVILRSIDLTHAAWTKDGAVVTGEQHDDDGTLSAFALTQTVATGPHRVLQAVTVSDQGHRTASIYLKARESSLVMVRLFGDNFTSYAAEFDLANGFITPGSSDPYAGTAASIIDVGDGWYRCAVGGFINAGPATLYVELNNAAHAGVYAGDGESGVLLWHPMIQASELINLYITTDATPMVGALITGLLSGVTYYFASTSYDTLLNESVFSSEVSKFIPWGLKTEIAMAASATCAASTNATLNIFGANFLEGSATCTVSVTGAIDATTTFASSATCSCSAVATAAFDPAAEFIAASTCPVSITATLTTAIAAASAPRGVASTIARLSILPVTFEAAATCRCSVSAAITATTTFASSAAGTCSATAAISTSILLAADASGVCSTLPALSSAGAIEAAATCVCATSVSLSTTSLLRASPIGACATAASLSFSTGQTLAATATGICSTTTSLLTGIRLAAQSTVACSGEATLSGGSFTRMLDNVQERFDERGIERGVFDGGG